MCIAGHFLSAKGGCQSCHPSCLSCTGSSASDCLHCEQPFYLHNSQCIQECPAGFFGSRGRCLPCPHGCQSCSSYTSCNQCSSSFHLYNNRLECDDDSISTITDWNAMTIPSLQTVDGRLECDDDSISSSIRKLHERP